MNELDETNKKKFTIIVAFNEKNRGIGKKGKLVWNLKEDMVFFKNITKCTKNPDKMNAVIMGRNTFESMKRNPLNDRINICITSQNIFNENKNLDFGKNIKYMKSLNDAIEYLSNINNIEKIFVIGGEQLYREAIYNENCFEIYANIIKNRSDEEEYDTFFPKIDLDRFILQNEFELSKNVICQRYQKIL